LSPDGLVPALKPLDIIIQGTRLLGAAQGDLRIAVAGSVTTDFLARAIAVGAAAENFAPVLAQAPFGAWRQEALDKASALHRFAPDIVVLATTARDMVADLPLDAPPEAVAAAIAACVAGFRQVWDALRRGAPGRRIIQHLPAAPAGLAGIGELRLAASPRAQVAALRSALLEAGPDIVFLETEGLAADPAAWFGAKLPFGQDSLPDYLARLRAALRQATGRGKKLLVLDLDNTLWGGVIGDDGVEALQLGPDSARGEAFAAFQAHARALAARGVILAVCSKNDPAIAAAGFSHPHSVLRREDFAAFECAWTDKAAGLRRIAAALNIGLDAAVFADDNQAECALIRAELPEVTVVALGDDPAAFIGLLEAGHWFETQGLTPEDFARGQAYQARARAAEAFSATADLAGFLRGLNMRGQVFEATGAALARIAQLEGKTNQFNLTTRRFDEAAIQNFAANPEALVLAATLADKFGDHGLVASLVAVTQGDALRIESWLMSCRVFSRTLEHFMLEGLLAHARARGAARILGRYVPTAKNGVVADLFETLGFAPAEDGFWQLPAGAPGPAHFITAAP
jgi:FkbH-like protein